MSGSPEKPLARELQRWLNSATTKKKRQNVERIIARIEVGIQRRTLPEMPVYEEASEPGEEKRSENMKLYDNPTNIPPWSSSGIKPQAVFITKYSRNAHIFREKKKQEERQARLLAGGTPAK